MSVISYALKRNPLIASLTDTRDLEMVLNSDCNIIILIQSDICSLKEMVDRIRETDKLIFVHLDLTKGLKRDASGVKFLSEFVGVDGIITTHTNLIQVAKQYDLLTIQRVFILDTASIKQGIKSINSSKPDAVEILPGVVIPHIKSYLKSVADQTIIAAGLINSKEEIGNILQNGAQGVSSSSLKLIGR
ncbi:glycerol-3-phosphate responsive antiterminator [Pseudogracilibacillus auburnensis]|uniref:Glycerol uptake operon antiterminator regulatory protein n=1 Tax=Pseudogracilibacillus auburnensis TaxID=1494959 RepID=A0A2V3VN92_9BACI|nr:glycerol-3-phosphate responsive antiterminator [Pseudogracilibacillus auburnensis]PXW82331.1 glycerol uptake operon antiterminator [Pseudogracilibacillus auburnensis]